MPRFDYTARSARGDALQGVVTASSSDEAARLLRGEGKFPIRLQELVEAAEAAAQPIRLGRGRVRQVELIHFAAQMGVMVDTGVALTEALQSILAQAPSPAFAEVLRAVLADVQAGQPLSTALAHHPRVFRALFVNLVRASEASGTLGPMLERCAAYLQNQRETRRKVVGAMIYPAFLLLMSAGVVVFLLTFILPRFTGIYAGREQLLPAPTKLLLASAAAFRENFLWIGGGGLAAIVLVVLFLRSVVGTRLVHRLAVTFPLLGGMLRRSYLVRCLRTLGTLLDAGVALLDAVQITRAVAGNRCFETLWDEVGEAVQRGEQLSRPLEHSTLVPRSVTQMVQAGERTGRLGEVLQRVCTFLEHELEETIKRLTQMVEPLMLLVMGTVVGSVVIALLLPIFTMSRMMGK